MVLEIIAKDNIFSVGGNLKGSYKIPTLVIQNPNSLEKTKIPTKSWRTYIKIVNFPNII